MTEPEKDALKKMIDEEVAKLSEHFDSVQIFVTNHAGGEQNTYSYEAGRGNFYARLGQISEWRCIQDQYQRCHAIRKNEGEEEE